MRIKLALTLRPVQLTAQISENLGEDERLVQGLCALLLGICIYYNDNSLENYTKYVSPDAPSFDW